MLQETTLPRPGRRPARRPGAGLKWPPRRPRSAMHDPRVPETLEGWWLLHQMFTVSWPAWQALSPAERRQKAAETARALGAMERGREGSSVPCTLLGHKGDLML